MHITAQPFTVHKRFALTISRGTTAQTTNVWVRLKHDGTEGWGEASPFSTGDRPQSTDLLLTTLQDIAPQLERYCPWERQAIAAVLQSAQVPSAACAAIDMAMHDWIGKAVQQPLWKLWGLDRRTIPPTSLTIGISSPDDARQRVRDWLTSTPAKALKIKLGSPAGIEADQAMFQAVQAEAPHIQHWSIDANGGWTLDGAVLMSHWLCDRGVAYLEQPLAKGQEDLLASLSARSPLPIFVDESCWVSSDIPKLAPAIAGINIKLMKCGGLSEARRMIATARACGLKVMFGCYSDSALANTAAAQLSPLADYIDLDSHLNLKDDPFAGALMESGCLVPNDAPGLGVGLISG
jgi:L-Ala-D/L-Glu epimerase